MTESYKVPSVAEIKANLKAHGALFEVVSLFAGGGGSSTGYRMAGGDVLAIDEFVPSARETYHANWPTTHIFSEDVRNLTADMILKQIGKKQGELDILDGSPPCCAFSVSGKRDKGWGQTHKYSDTKQGNIEDLFFEYLRILEGLQPRCCVAENVAGLAIGSAKGYCNEILRGFDKAGYVVRAKILNAKWLGVPQNRPRLIFVGVRKDLWRDEFKDKTHPKPFDHIVTMREAFEGLTLTDEEREDTDLRRFAIYRELIKLRQGESSSRYFNLVKGNPLDVVNTITATTGTRGAAKPCHWDNRAYSVRELRRLTSIPDDYILAGDYSQQVERLGRMVPPFMMKAVAENLFRNILSKVKNGHS